MELHAPSHWRTLEFHSDVHLYEQDPATFEAWASYMAASQADAIFILGDLFEVWVGDDALSPNSAFDLRMVQALRECAGKRPVFYIPGNRDFLVGDPFLRSVGLQRLPDPTVLCIGGQRIALSHGDALCTDDLPYQQFRAEVRTRQWQREFLALPLEARLAKARGIRQASEARKQETAAYVDVNTGAVAALLEKLQADTLIHGHTHLAGIHALAHGKQRLVLSDWSADATPPRLEILRCELSPNVPMQCTRVNVGGVVDVAEHQG
jgi:UDP-2,3-diacylglucosamine hydrolase